MTSREGRWRVTRSTPVRADADGLFIPVDELSGATVGDLVIVSGPNAEDDRNGVIAELTYGSGRPFFRIEMDQ